MVKNYIQTKPQNADGTVMLRAIMGQNVNSDILGEERTERYIEFLYYPFVRSVESSQISPLFDWKPSNEVI